MRGAAASALQRTASEEDAHGKCPTRYDILAVEHVGFGEHALGVARAMHDDNLSRGLFR